MADMSHASAGDASGAWRPPLGRALALLGFLTVVASAAPARAAAQGEGAARQRVAVARLTFQGGVSETARELFAQRITEGLAAARFDVLTGAMVRERLAAAGLGADSCAGGSCTGKAARALDVAFLVFASVVERDKSYDVTLELVNGKSGLTIGTSRERCEICGVEEASEKVGLAATALRARLEALADEPARFMIRSRPTGARLTLDGEALGKTPVDRELPAGVHKLELRAEGYDNLERTVTAVNGVDETLELELVVKPTKLPLRPMGYGAIAVGIAAIAGSVWAMSVDGDELACDVAEEDDLGHCPRVRSTRVLGAILAGVGAASATLGGVWLYLGGWGRPQRDEAQTASVGVSGRF
jgi:hypothetical protein